MGFCAKAYADTHACKTRHHKLFAEAFGAHVKGADFIAPSCTFTGTRNVNNKCFWCFPPANPGAASVFSEERKATLFGQTLEDEVDNLVGPLFSD